MKQFETYDCDCLIVGGGPAGLTAALYLGRFHLNVTVVDGGKSRAALIPRSRNQAGFPRGIAGPELLERMREQAIRYGARLLQGDVSALQQDGPYYLARVGDQIIAARTILLATGVVNRRPPMLDDHLHDLAIAAGLLRYCPVCDGFEVTDKRVAVLGTGARGCAEAEFLRSFTAEVTLAAPADGHDLSAAQRARLETAGIRIAGICRAIEPGADVIMLDIAGVRQSFDTLYPALGLDVRSELAGQLGAHRSEEGCLMVDAHQRTSVPGLYAAGDVVLGLDQIGHAIGEGGVAATTIRNDLAAASPLRR